MRSSFGIFLLGFLCTSIPARSTQPVKRVVILKIDGLNADLLNHTMEETDPLTGKSRLPWFTHIFAENGTIFENFYTRGISLSAPSWSMLDTGHHTVIRGNVEYDRYTGRVYDYLNFFPFYVAYARNQHVDMPGVEVLDRAGIPLVIDSFPYSQGFQSFQLFQRGVRWSTIISVMNRRLRSELLSPVESGAPEPLAELLNQQTESELKLAAGGPEVLYLDLYTGDIDHEGHATNQGAALTAALKTLDALAARLWTAIQASPMAAQTIFVAVSDHGMNNRPERSSQGFSLPDFFNSPAGGGHHVVTNRHQLSDYKILGLDPLVQRVVNPSTASPYLAGQADHYPTAWLDLDGNERAAVHLRNNDLNRIHILLLQLERKDLSPPQREAGARYLHGIIESHRQSWIKTGAEMEEALDALDNAIEKGRAEAKTSRHRLTGEDKRNGLDKAALRNRQCLASWQSEVSGYRSFLTHQRALLGLKNDYSNIEKYLPSMELGDSNTPSDLQHYVIGPGEDGLIISSDGTLNEERAFRHVDYLPLLLSQKVRNNLQPQLSDYPIDFVAMHLPDESGHHAYWLYGSPDAQLVILTDEANHLAIRTQNGWRSGLPLRLFEDPDLAIPAGADRTQWLSAWHTEAEWLAATHRCRYSNGVIGITEELSPVEDNVPGLPRMDPILLRYERRRRALVQADFHIFAADGWNFNARNFNPGGNHGGFFRISTHSVWMMAGAGVPVRTVQEPYDSLNFASTILSLLGKPVPMPDRVVSLAH